MYLFYSINIDKDNKEIEVIGQENIHLVKVLRKVKGEKVDVTDGEGGVYNCQIIEINKTKSTLKINNYTHYKCSMPSLKIGISLTKKIDRFEWFIEKATEIGISEITPIITKNTERNKFNHERTNRLLVSAMKQSLRYYLPKINKAKNFIDYLKDRSDNHDLFIATCLNSEKKLFKNELIKGNNCNIIIGPEGGFNQKELDLAKKAKFVPISLGKSRLKTETAGVMVCSIFSIIN